jgi:hypothetical protein
MRRQNAPAPRLSLPRSSVAAWFLSEGIANANVHGEVPRLQPIGLLHRALPATLAESRL